MTSTNPARPIWHRTRLALLLAPALLAGCYVVPIVPRPVYGPGYERPYPGSHHHRHHRHWRGEATDGAAVVAATPQLHIEVASSSR